MLSMIILTICFNFIRSYYYCSCNINPLVDIRFKKIPIMKRLRTKVNAVDKQRGSDDIVTALHDDNNIIHKLKSVHTDSHTLERSDYNADCDIEDVDQHDNNNDLTTTTAIVTDTYQHINTWYDLFISDRNWYYCESIWSKIIKHNSTISSANVPDYIEGYTYDSPYGVSKLSEINQVGQRSEFISKNHKYLCRQTFALRIGYDGQQYYGYQRQKNFNGLTVEEDILKIMKLPTTGAGRTDRGVSAISQIINFNTNNMNLTSNDIYEKFRQSKPCLDGRLTIYDCYRVPKKFHSRASATWRRYLYMFPLKRISTDQYIKNHNNSDDNSNNRNNFYYNNDDVDKDDSLQQHGNNCDSSEKIKFADNNIQKVKDKYDVDVNYLNIVLSKLENRDLPYNAFAFKEDRVQGEGLLDHCTIYKATATIINLADIIPSSISWNSSSFAIKTNISTEGIIKDEDVDDTKKLFEQMTNTTDDDIVELIDIDNANTDARYEETSTTRTTAKATMTTHEKMSNNNNNKCEQSGVVEARSTIRSSSNRYPGYRPSFSSSFNKDNSDESDLPAICIELVGSRFLRRMVRILTATAIREAVKDPSERNDNILVDICLSGDRTRAARALPGPPLCLAGVGYDKDDMAIYKFMPKIEYNALINEKNMLNNNNNNNGYVASSPTVDTTKIE